MTRAEQYNKWMSDNYPSRKEALSKCQEASKKMKEAFPELRVTNGFISLPFELDEKAHWWCVTPDGEIVDPTSIQYGTCILDYEEINDEHPARKYRLAKCMNCGEQYYETPELKGVMHNSSCEKEFAESMDG